MGSFNSINRIALTATKRAAFLLEYVLALSTGAQMALSKKEKTSWLRWNPALLHHRCASCIHLRLIWLSFWRNFFWSHSLSLWQLVCCTVTSWEMRRLTAFLISATPPDYHGTTHIYSIINSSDAGSFLFLFASGPTAIQKWSRLIQSLTAPSGLFKNWPKKKT